MVMVTQKQYPCKRSVFRHKTFKLYLFDEQTNKQTDKEKIAIVFTVAFLEVNPVCAEVMHEHILNTYNYT